MGQPCSSSLVLLDRNSFRLGEGVRPPHPPQLSPQSKVQEGGEGQGWVGVWGWRARSLLVNQCWFPRWSCSRFDFSSCPLLCSLTPSSMVSIPPLKSSGASFQTSPAPPTPNNSLSYRKEKGEGARWLSLEEKERNLGEGKGTRREGRRKKGRKKSEGRAR